MFMFLPFLLSLVAVLAVMYGICPPASTGLFLAALIATLASFAHHVSDPLSLSF